MTKKIRLSAYVSPKKYKEVKIWCAHLGISMSHFIDMALEEKADRERKQYGFKRIQENDTIKN